MSHPVVVATIMRPEGDTGVQTHFRAFSHWLTSKGAPWRILTPFSSPRWMVYPVFAVRRMIEPLNGAVSVWWYRYWHMHFLRRALHSTLRKEGPCVVYAQCPVSAASALQARRSNSQRVVMVVHFNVSQADEWVGKGYIDQGGKLFRAIRAFEERVLPELDGLVFVSDFMRREVLQRIPAIANVPYRVIPNFLADSGCPEATPEPVADLICVGTLEPRKNQRFALEVVAAAQKAGKRLCLTVVGDGPDRGVLMTHADKLGIKGDVHFLGHVKHAAVLMQSHKACLHVARFENLPITLIEAMAAGIPVFAPAVGGIPEVFEDGVEGRQIPLDKPEAAAKLIVNWLRDPEILARAGQAARQRFVSKFESSVVASELMAFLQSDPD